MITRYVSLLQLLRRSLVIVPTWIDFILLATYRKSPFGKLWQLIQRLLVTRGNVNSGFWQPLVTAIASFGNIWQLRQRLLATVTSSTYCWTSNPGGTWGTADARAASGATWRCSACGSSANRHPTPEGSRPRAACSPGSSRRRACDRCRSCRRWQSNAKSPHQSNLRTEKNNGYSLHKRGFLCMIGEWSWKNGRKPTSKEVSI